MKKETNKYAYERFGCSAQRIGQAVLDIVSSSPPSYTVEDILDELGKDWLDLIRQRAEEGKLVRESPFYILSLLNKDLGQFEVDNVLKHSARHFQYEKSMKDVMSAHPSSVKNLFKVDVKNGEISLEWSLPGWEDCRSIMKNPSIYDPQLVKWVSEIIASFSPE